MTESQNYHRDLRHEFANVDWIFPILHAVLLDSSN